jgi:hypothetical protein
MVCGACAQADRLVHVFSSALGRLVQADHIAWACPAGTNVPNPRDFGPLCAARMRACPGCSGRRGPRSSGPDQRRLIRGDVLTPRRGPADPAPAEVGDRAGEIDGDQQCPAPLGPADLPGRPANQVGPGACGHPELGHGSEHQGGFLLRRELAPGLAAPRPCASCSLFHNGIIGRPARPGKGQRTHGRQGPIALLALAGPPSGATRARPGRHARSELLMWLGCNRVQSCAKPGRDRRVPA